MSHSTLFRSQRRRITRPCRPVQRLQRKQLTITELDRLLRQFERFELFYCSTVLSNWLVNVHATGETDLLFERDDWDEFRLNRKVIQFLNLMDGSDCDVAAQALRLIATFGAFPIR